MAQNRDNEKPVDDVDEQAQDRAEVDEEDAEDLAVDDNRYPQDLTHLLVRAPRLEDRFNVRLSGLYASGMKIEEVYDITISGEIHAAAGDEIAEDLDLVAVAYDEKGRVLSSTFTSFFKDKFFELDIFRLRFEVPLCPSKLRVFPRAY